MITIELVEKLIEFFPDASGKLSEGLDLLNTAIDDLLSCINLEIQISLKDAKKDTNYENIKEFVNLHEKLKQCYIENSDYIELIDENDNISDDNIETYKKTVDKVVPDYDKYIVDSNKPHSLYEDYSHKRPTKFSFEGQMYYSEKWNDILVRTCELLADKNPKIIESFLTDEGFFGRKKRIFANDRAELRKPVRIKNMNLYVETNQSANSIKKIIRTMLNKFGIDIQSYLVYFKADYTELHKN